MKKPIIYLLFIALILLSSCLKTENNTESVPAPSTAGTSVDSTSDSGQKSKNLLASDTY